MATLAKPSAIPVPFALDCFTSVFKYWYRLDSSTNFLLKNAYIENKFLHSQGCDTWYSGLQRLFKIFDNNTGIHNMLKYKHNTLKEKLKFIQKPFIKISGMLREINFQMKRANCEPI